VTRTRFKQRSQLFKPTLVETEAPCFLESKEFRDYVARVAEAISKEPLNTRQIKQKCGEAFNCLDAIRHIDYVIEKGVCPVKYHRNPAMFPKDCSI
jgi:hypothetical protein